MNGMLWAAGAILLGVAGFAADGQGLGADDKYVSREDYERLKEDHERLRRELEDLKSLVHAAHETEVIKHSATDRAIDDLDLRLDDTWHKTKAMFPGTSQFFLAGYGAGTFELARAGYGPATLLPPATPPRPRTTAFNASFNPIFLWKLSDRLLFESALELELKSHATGVGLEYAQLDYVLNRFMILAVGKFLDPMDYFTERLHPHWINKLPDRPLAVYDGLLPESELGVQLRAGIPVGRTKLEYSIFVANAPELNLGAAAKTVPADLGTLGFDNFDNHNGHLATGGRVGYFLTRELELGYGFQFAPVGPGGSNLDAFLHSVDLNYVHDSRRLQGFISLRGQWVWSNVDRFTYDPNGSLGFGPYQFSNDRNGGYVQLAYRPSKAGNRILENFEAIVRYDRLDQASTPVGFDENRWTVGLDYWLGPSTVVKVAYELDRQHGAGQNGNAFLMQFATGF
jgi:hypothetical protein